MLPGPRTEARPGVPPVDPTLPRAGRLLIGRTSRAENLQQDSGRRTGTVFSNRTTQHLQLDPWGKSCAGTLLDCKPHPGAHRVNEAHGSRRGIGGTGPTKA